MRIKIRHETRYTLEGTARRAMQYLRLTPRYDRSQMVVNWSISGPENLNEWQDGFGNTVHYATESSDHQSLSILVEGEVVTSDTSGIIPLDDGLPPVMFLRETGLTAVERPLERFAGKFSKIRESDGDIPFLHAMMEALADHMDFEKGHSTVTTQASKAFSKKKGVCQDFAHIFIAMCRCHNIPARYVSGYITDGTGDLATHGWAECYVEGLGWVSFDVANRQSATDAYVHLAIGYDYASCAPVIGVRTGGGEEELRVNVQVEQVQS